MTRPIWSGAITFGLVNVPIKLYSTVKRKTVRFNQLRKSDNCRIQLKKVCATDGIEVANQEIVKGYEISPDRYVVITDEDLAAISPATSHSIAIEDFVQLAQIDPLYYMQSYYLIPDKGAGKAYALLLAAMKKSQKVAIAKFVLRNKEYLSAIRPTGSVLSLSTMYFADEIIELKEFDSMPKDEVEPDERELKIALQLIESLSKDFEPGNYQDEYRRKIFAMIDTKAEGQTVVVEKPSETQKGKVIDLMAALEASLSAIKKNQSETKKPKQRKRTARAR
ncbi:MAG: ykoV [Firmicutes bacterium]|nr:ykoV [Bacillota bacterium]